MTGYRWDLFDACPKCGARQQAPCRSLLDGGQMRTHHARRRKLSSRGHRRNVSTRMTVDEIKQLARNALALGKLHAADTDDAYIQGFVGGWAAARLANIPHTLLTEEPTP